MKLQWNQINWKKAEEQVNRLQVRIVKATLEQKWRLVKRLQYLITNSFYAKDLAVKRHLVLMECYGSQIKTKWR